MSSKLPVDTRDGAQNETEAATVHDGSPETPMPAAEEGEKI
jgi:hypothetical protein